MIADDEQWIRRWLEKIVPQLRNDLEIVISFDNGKDALDYLSTNEIDIVITDIRMPLMTGLEVIDYAKKYKMKTRFILISGYDEFNYAKKGIQLQVSGYLLKPIEKLELKQVLDDVIHHIEQSKRKVIGTETVRDVVSKVLYEMVMNEEDIDARKIIDIARNGECNYMDILVGIVQVDIMQANKSDNMKKLNELLSIRLPECDNYLIKENALNYLIFSFVKEKDSYKNYEGESQRLKRKIKEIIDGSNVIFSRWFEDVSDLYTQFTYCKEKIFVQDIEVSTHMIKGNSLQAIQTNVFNDVKAKNVNAMKKDLLHAKRVFSENGISILEFRIMVFGLMNNIIKLLEAIDSEQRDEYIHLAYEFCVKINEYHNIDAMLEWIINYLDKVITLKDNNESFNVTLIVKKVCTEMIHHYDESMNLTTVCEQYGINASYFSKKFKEEAGMNFVDMLTNIRLDAARKLLESTDYTIKEISNKVGFHDSKYFSRVFLQIEGCSPKNYRKKHDNLKDGETDA